MPKLAKIAISTLVYLVAFDLIGVVASFVFDVLGALPLRGSSTALFYAIWFVLGVFCGILSYQTGGSMYFPKSEGDWTTREDAGKAGLVVVLITSGILVTLSVAFYLIFWRGSWESSVFVPDSGPLTLTFFGTVLASVIFAHRSLRPVPKKKS